MPEKRVKGSCFCGAIAFEIELPTKFCGHCHCSMCRRPHGASFVTWVGVVPEQFSITAGQENVATYQSSKNGTRSFCRVCGSQMFCQTHDDVIDIALAALNGEIDRAPEVHWYYDSRADWTEVNDDLPKLGGEDGATPL
ncbi:MAG: GFA family protein [Pseudomonadota bacterium]